MLTAKHKAELRKWLPGKDFHLIYKATRDGCSPQSFHTHCNNKGPTLSVGFNSTGYVFGGYTNQPWTGVGNWKQDAGAFLFRLCQQNGTSNPKQYNVTNVAYSMYDHATYGPSFGAGHDLHFFKENITFDAANGYLPTNGSGKIGISFNAGGDNMNTFCGSDFKFKDIEVYEVQELAMAEAAEKPYWRKICGGEAWTSEVQEALMAKISAYKTPYKEVSAARILLLGPIGSGKSSFYNTINSIFQRRITCRAISGADEHSLTKKLRMRGVKSEAGEGFLRFYLCDTMGVEVEKGLDIVGLPFLLDGMVPNGYPLQNLGSASPSDSKFIQNPTLSQKFHCVAFVIDGTRFDVTSAEVLTEIKRMKKLVFDKEIPLVVLLTKIDKMCKEVEGDASKVFQSEEIEKVAKSVSGKLQIPFNCVLPVMNYEQDTELHVATDILALTALNQMLGFASDFVEEHFDVPEDYNEYTGQTMNNL